MHILIPAKALDAGKARLGVRLDRPGRAALCERFLRQTLSLALAAAPATVLTPDPRAAAIAGRAGARALLEPPGIGLNGALDWARGQLEAGLETADSLLVLPTDLPSLSLAGLLSLGSRPDCVTIATDRRLTGTNLLVLPRRALGEFRFAFGEGSAQAHRREARRLGWPARIEFLPEAAFDVDLPEDLYFMEETLEL